MMIKYNQRHHIWGFYTVRDQWVATIGHHYLGINIGKGHTAIICLGTGRQKWYENYYFENGHHLAIYPSRGHWDIRIEGKPFRYWQLWAIWAEIRMLRATATVPTTNDT